MKKFCVAFILIKGFLAEAGDAILVAPPDLSESIYQEVLNERNDLLSPQQAAILKFQQEEVRPEIFLLADQCLSQGKCQTFSKNFEKFREQKILNPKERQLLLELWKKSGRPMDCYWQESPHCKFKKLAVEKLGIKKGQTYVIFIDGIIFNPEDDILLLPQRKYYWQIISARFQPKSTWATIEEVENQISLNNPYVTGGCLAFSPVGPSITENMYVAFDRSCVRPLRGSNTTDIHQRSDTWIERNKTWVISALIMTLGAGYYMKDKQVEFSSPFK